MRRKRGLTRARLRVIRRYTHSLTWDAILQSLREKAAS